MPDRQVRALITGGSSGIGRCLVEELFRRGWQVVAVSNVPAELATLDPGITGWEADLSRPEEVAALVPRFEAEIGPLDVLVNNAGIGYHATLLELEASKLRQLFEVNFFALVQLSQAALLRMAPRGRGHILNVSSASARRSLARMTAYGASKGAVHTFTQSLRLEAATYGVRVSEVLPISVRTPFFAAAWSQGEYRPRGKTQGPEQVALQIVRCLERGIPELCTDRMTGWGFVLDALAPNLVSRLLEWIERRSPAPGSRPGS